MTIQRALSLLLMAAVALTPVRATSAPREIEKPVDVLVVAPHPDDEALCCAGVISSAIARGQRVHVLVMTNGGTWALAAAQLAGKPAENLVSADFAALAHARQLESLVAMEELGVPAADVTLLGYPDDLSGLYDANASASAARAVIVAALARSIADLHPREVYAPSAADTHPTHAATHRFVRDALVAAHWHGQMRNYVIHSGQWQQWPWPASMTPTAGYEAHDVNGNRIPYEVVWPPAVRVPLTSDLASLKLTSIHKYASQIAISQTFLESFVKDEEVFWPEEL